MGVSISLCMIVKNEEENLEACLLSAKGIADEINIVDTGSTDKTVEIAKRYTDRVFYFEWVNDFSKARNFSFSKATKDYIMWLDADDIITPENRKRLLAIKEKLNDDIRFVVMRYNCRHNRNGAASEVHVRERIVKRSENFEWKGAIHEFIDVRGNYMESDAFITHNDAGADMEASFARNNRIIEELVEGGADDIRTLTYYIQILTSRGKNEEALIYTKKIISLPPEEQLNSFDLCLVYKTAHRIYLLKGDEKAALKVLEDGEELLSDNAEFYCLLGSFYKNSKNDAAKALSSYQKALRAEGKNKNGSFIFKKEEYYYFEPLRLIANCFNELKQYDDALFYFNKALEFSSGNEDHMFSVCIDAHALYLKKGDDEAALSILLRHEALFSNKSEYNCVLGAFYNYKQDTQKALECFLKALDCKNKKQDGNIYYYYEPLRSAANCYIKLKRFQEALVYFKKALEYRPGDAPTLDIIAKLERIAEMAKL